MSKARQTVSFRSQNQARKQMHILYGILAGLIATVPMTVAMIVAFRFLSRSEKYPLPPKEIINDLIS